MGDRVEVTLYTRDGCHLCDQAKAAIRAAESLYRLRIDLREVDIDTDADLHARFTNDVPVIYVGGKEAFRHQVDPRQLAEVVRGGARLRSSLADETCVPCRGGVPALHGEELNALARELGDGWRVLSEHHLERGFRFPDFAQALAFTNRIGALAEEEGHHPDIHLGWGRVRIEIWTHAIDGLTRSDFILAAKIDRLMLGLPSGRVP
jgi:4a-hydroxytetrahydrobiopterin dehydratase